MPPGTLQFRGLAPALVIYVLVQAGSIPLDEEVCQRDFTRDAARRGSSQLQAGLHTGVEKSHTPLREKAHIASNASAGAVAADGQAQRDGTREAGQVPGSTATHVSAAHVRHAHASAAADDETSRQDPDAPPERRPRRAAGQAFSSSIAMVILVPLCGVVAFGLYRSEPVPVDTGEPPVRDTMTYKIYGLSTWAVFRKYPCTVWDNDTLWLMIQRIVGVAFIVATIELMLVPDPFGIDAFLFDQIGSMLHVFVGLLLSFFLAANVTRWCDIVGGFLVLFNSTRNLQLAMHSFGCHKDNAELALRYCVLSGHLVSQEMKRAQMSKEERQVAVVKMWEELEMRDSVYLKVLPEERAQLQDVQDPSNICWTWVMSLLGRMSQDGELPPMGAGTFGLVLGTANDAKKGMDGLRDLITVQLPFVYVHTVATIVQLNTVLAAVSLGLTFGATAGDTLARANKYFHFYREPLTHQHRPIMEDVQEVLVQIFRCFVAPLLYQAFFEIGVSIASPFYSEDGSIPVERMLDNLERQLLDSKIRAETPPSWQAPSLKQR